MKFVNHLRKQFQAVTYRQSAQGMVEFALVLPLLLLIIFGIFAFGHLLFSYSVVVAASREAARFGIATGLSDTNVPRFRDCDAIRNAAVRIGSVIGVRPEDVSIVYDEGPHLDGSDADVYPDGCPIGGVGPGYIEIGDRIVVSIDLTYESIVPVGIIPEIPLSAVTRRTIIRTLPLADAPVAPGSACVGTIMRVVPPEWIPNKFETTTVVGEPIQYKADVIADDPGIAAPGTIKLYYDDPDYTSADCSGTTGGSTSVITCAQVNWFAVGEHTLYAEYDPGANATTTPCFGASKAEPWKHVVIPADTVITMLTIEAVPDETPDTIYYGDPLKITVRVKAVAPSVGIPEGEVVLWEGDKQVGTITVGPVSGLTGTAQGTLEDFTFADGTGVHVLTARYDPDPGIDPNYNQSPPFDSDPIELIRYAPGLSLVMRVDKDTYDSAGDVIRYEYDVINNGTVTFAGPIHITDSLNFVACPTGNLNAGAMMTCSASYKVTQGDVDSGSVTNTAHAYSGEISSDEQSKTVTAAQTPALSLEMSAAPAVYASVDDVINYSYVVTNTGNLTLSGPFTVTDSKIANVICPAKTLLPGENVTCTASYTITQADLDAGSMTNTATAHGVFGTTTIDSNTDTETVPFSAYP